MSTSLLMIEDDLRLAQMVGEYLGQSGMQLAHCPDAASGLARLQGQDGGTLPELVILDLMLPDMDGLEVCRRIRALPGVAARVPVLMLTAKGDPMDRVIGLEIGADDYLPKPFEPRELLARIRALLRRSNNQIPVVQVGQLQFDTTTRLATIGERQLNLTKRELALLEALLSRKDKPVTRDALFEKIFDMDNEAQPETIELYVHRLRKKLEGSGVAITTLRGLGYLISEQSRDR